MPRLAAAACAALLLSLSAPAAAFVVEVTTSVSVEDARDDGQLNDALQTAVDSVLNEAIAFRPTVIVLTHAMVLGNRLAASSRDATSRSGAPRCGPTFRDGSPGIRPCCRRWSASAR